MESTQPELTLLHWFGQIDNAYDRYGRTRTGGRFGLA